MRRGHLFVGLNAGQTQWTDPFDGLACMCDNFGALGEPFLDLISVGEEVTDALDCQFS